MTPSGIEPAKEILCHDISVALPNLLSGRYLKTESCICEPKIRNQLLFHAFYLPDDRVRLKILRINSQYVLRQQSTESGSTENTMFRNSQNVVLSCVYRTNISLKWLQEILQQHYGECAMKIALVA